MVDSGSQGSPVDRAREALQRADNLIRVATSRLIVLREMFERRHLRAADMHGLEAEILSLREAIEESLDHLLEAWAEFSSIADELASEEEASS